MIQPVRGTNASKPIIDKPGQNEPGIPLIDEEKKMINIEELESIDVKEAKELLKEEISTGELLLRESTVSFGSYNHWARVAFTALEPLPSHQEHFRLKCWERRASAESKLREGIHLLKQALRAMDDPQFGIDDPSPGYRKLIMSLPD